MCVYVCVCVHVFEKLREVTGELFAVAGVYMCVCMCVYVFICVYICVYVCV